MSAEDSLNFSSTSSDWMMSAMCLSGIIHMAKDTEVAWYNSVGDTWHMGLVDLEHLTIKLNDFKSKNIFKYI